MIIFRRDSLIHKIKCDVPIDVLINNNMVSDKLKYSSSAHEVLIRLEILLRPSVSWNLPPTKPVSYIEHSAFMQFGDSHYMDFIAVNHLQISNCSVIRQVVYERTFRTLEQ